MDKYKALNAAQKHALKGGADKAIQEISKLVQASPRDKRLHLKLGDLYLRNGDNGKAIKEYLLAGDLYAEDGFNTQAIAIYKKILSLDSKPTDSLRKIAQCYLREGLTASAKVYCQKLLARRPGDEEAQKILAEIEGTKTTGGDHAPAPSVEMPLPPTAEIPFVESDQNPVIELDAPIPSEEKEGPSLEKESEVHYHLGIGYLEMELFDYAIAEFEQATSYPPIQFDCYIMLASCFEKRGDYDQCLKYLALAKETKDLSKGELARLYFHMGIAFEGKGIVSEAIKFFGLTLGLDPSSAEAKEKIKNLQQQTHP